MTGSPLFVRPTSPEFRFRTDTNAILSSIDYTENGRKSKALPECIVNLMRFGWKLPSPQLIISVTGGARLFKLPTPRVRHAFQRGLIAAAVTTGEYSSL
jgi:hypothetical protein